MTNETLDLFEARIHEDLTLLGTETDEKERERLVREVEKLSTKMTEAEEMVYKYASDEAQRALDDVKSQRAYDAEVVKAKVDWKRTAIEVGKVAIPAAVSLMTLSLWNEKFEQVLKFEESGRFTSTGFRLLKFPKLT